MNPSTLSWTATPLPGSDASLGDLTIQSAIHAYTVHTENGCLTDDARANAWIATLDPQKTVLVADRKMLALYSRLSLVKTLKGRTIPVNATEKQKSLNSVQALYNAFLKLGVTRKHRILVLGGGITQDIAGFTSQTYMRGLEWWFLPSTLLAQADSCVGSKNSINHASTKNLLGSFYPPKRIYIDPSLLRTLKHGEIISGLGESLKVHCMDTETSLDAFIRDLPRLKQLQADLISHYIAQSLAIKLRYVEPDEFDRGTRQVLNFGHCYGHAFEAASNFKTPHGIAVALGLVFAYKISLDRKYISPRDYEKVCRATVSLLQPYAIPKIKNSQILHYLQHDKKREGAKLAVILTKGVGQTFKALNVTEAEFQQGYLALEALRPLCAQQEGRL